ncbi:hypothetical protein V1264_007325 [Littorina saxatilis]
MALSSDRMRFKDKIIANIAKAIKGIQEAVYFRSQTTADDSPLILRNNDRQCHKLCENLDHVFLHGLKHHSNGYWKVVTEYTHKNAVKELRNLANVTTDLGRGRAWIFMALNDSLLESYIRCVADNVKFLKKFYAKDALLLDQQQMSVLLTLTSGLECVVFQLEYDLPYLDLTAYPPRTRTASELEEDDADHVSLRSAGSIASRPSTETAASTPESTRGMTDSDTASLSSLDTSALRNSSARVSSVSMDSGFPVDMVSIQSSKQRSVTPTDTMSISSHGSGGEPDRLMRLESLVSKTEEVEETEGGLEVIRLKSGKKPATGSRKKRSGLGKKSSKRVVSPVSSATVFGSSVGGGDLEGNSGRPIDIQNSAAAKQGGQKSAEAKSRSFGTSPAFGKTPPGGKSLPCGKSPASDTTPNKVNFFVGSPSPDIPEEERSMTKSQGVMSRSSEQDLENLTTETKNSMVDSFTKLETTVASIRATTTTLHQHQDNDNPQQTFSPDSRNSSSKTGATFTNENSVQFGTSPQSFSASTDSVNKRTSANAALCDNNVTDSAVPEQNSKVPHPAGKMSALEELESKCAQLCGPLTSKGNDSVDHCAFDFSEGTKENSVGLGVNSAVISSSERSSYQYQNGIQAKETSKQEDEEDVDFYSAPGKVGVREDRSHSVGQLHDYMDYIAGHHDDHSEETINEVEQQDEQVMEKERKEWTKSKDYALSLDNNTKLQIMLDVFTKDDEEFIKMFVTREGHSEGEVKVTYVVVTSRTLYLLKRRELDHKFQTELAIPLKDLNFITLSLNKQIINIESSGPNRRKRRIWLTPGDHLLAQQILDCLEAAMLNIEQPTTVRSHCSIGSDEPLQIIALRKYISRDSNCESLQEHEVEIEDYSLVFWEDTQSNKDKQMSTAREGTMLLRTNDPFKGHVWNTVYVILRDFMLCVFANKTDNKPQQYVRLGGEQCVGCRLVTTQEREYCIEIILAKRESWFLSVASEEEVASWRQSLCLAVSEGMQDSANLSCLPCVSVVTGQKLLLCHEDVQTKFCRTIASAKVEEVTALTVDPEVKTYCIVEFESQEYGVSSERWVLYFNAPLEMDRFVEALSRVWKEVYQVGLVAGSIEDLPLQRHCQDQATLLQHAISLK